MTTSISNALIRSGRERESFGSADIFWNHTQLRGLGIPYRTILPPRPLGEGRVRVGLVFSPDSLPPLTQHTRVKSLDTVIRERRASRTRRTILLFLGYSPFVRGAG